MTTEVEASAPESTRGKAYTVLSGKGGCGKSFILLHVGAQASYERRKNLLMDADPEGNLTAKFLRQNPSLKGAPGLSDVLLAAGCLDADADFNIEAGAEKLLEVIQPLEWSDTFMVPPGKQLLAISQHNASGDYYWLLRDIMEEAGIYDDYQLIGLDTAGRRGSLVNLIMYACDVAFSPINQMEDSIIKAKQARDRVEQIQEAHPLRWLGVVLTGLDRRAAINQDNQALAVEEFGPKTTEDGKIVRESTILIDLPYRPAVLHQTYELGQRLADTAGATHQSMAKMFSNLLNVIRTSAPQATAPSEVAS